MLAARHFFRQAEINLVAAAMAAQLAGCSSLTPQIFSDRMVTEPTRSSTCTTAGVSSSITLDCALEDAAQVKARYMVAVRDQGNALPLLSAGLIGLSGVTLFKGMTHPNTNDMVGAGVVGSTAWALGSTQLSKPRLDVYRAGADALMCAMTAMEPLRPGQGTLGLPADDGSMTTLYGRRAAVITKRNELESLLLKHAALNQNTTKTAVRSCKPVLRAASCSGLEKPGLSADEVELERARCNALHKIKSPQCTSEVTTRPPQRVRDAFNEANAEVTAATQQVSSALETIKALREAGPALAKKTADIQLAVSREVDKTVPNLASVMAAAAGMRDIGFTLTAAKPGVMQGEAPIGTMTPEEKSALADIERVTSELGAARNALEELASLSLGTDQTQARKTLNDCVFKFNGVVKLSVTPSGDSITVALGDSAVFFVSGGSGVPTAAVIAGPKAAAVPLKVEGGQFRFEFTPPQGTKPGDKFTLRFADGADVAERLVEIIIATTPSPTVTDDTPPAKIETASTPNKGKFKNLTNDNLAALGLPDNAGEKAIQAAVDKCQSNAKPRIAVTHDFDEATKKALKDKTCSPRG